MAELLPHTADSLRSGGDEQEFEVTREAVRKYAIATGVTAPEHLNHLAAQSAGYRDMVAPQYFFVSLGLALDQVCPRSQLSPGGIPLDDPLAGRRVMAGETSVTWHDSIFAGDSIRVRRTFVSIIHKTGRSGTFDVYTFKREYLRDDDLLIEEQYSRIAR